jgi:hypothetical protein
LGKSGAEVRKALLILCFLRPTSDIKVNADGGWFGATLGHRGEWFSEAKSHPNGMVVREGVERGVIECSVDRWNHSGGEGSVEDVINGGGDGEAAIPGVVVR